MDIKIILSADEKALEFSRNLGKFFGAYVSQTDVEAGICGKLAEGVTAQKAAEEQAAKAIQEHNAKREAAAAKPKSISDEELRASYAGDAAKKKKAGDWLKAHGLKAVSSIPQEDRKDFLAAVNA